jgi:thioredoxin-related protein
MSTTIFPQEECGNFFNDKFVCVKVQLDTSAKDNDAVKSWYQDGHNLAEQYTIRAYPTFLVFAPDGHIVHRIVGGGDAKSIIARAQEAFDPNKQYYTLLQQYQAGKKDSAFLRKMAEQSVQVYDMTTAREVSKAYFATQPNIYNTACLDLLDQLTTRSIDDGFDVFLHHSREVDKIAGPGKAEKKVNEILLREHVYPKIFGDNATAPDWTALQSSLAAIYPAQAPEVIEQGKVIYYQQKGDWANFQTSVVAYMKKYGANASSDQLNDYAWTVFQKCPDMKCVTEALEWSKRSFKDNQNPQFMDTYANILYKMGKKDDAIAWEEKAIQLSDDATRTSLQPTLDKMKKGEKTWD